VALMALDRLIDGFPVEAVMAAEILVLRADHRAAEDGRQFVRG